MEQAARAWASRSAGTLAPATAPSTTRSPRMTAESPAWSRPPPGEPWTPPAGPLRARTAALRAAGTTHLAYGLSAGPAATSTGASFLTELSRLAPSESLRHLRVHQASDRTLKEHTKALDRFSALLRAYGYDGDHRRVDHASVNAAVTQMARERAAENEMVQPKSVTTFVGRIVAGARVRRSTTSQGWSVLETSEQPLGYEARRGVAMLHDRAVKTATSRCASRPTTG